MLDEGSWSIDGKVVGDCSLPDLTAARRANSQARRLPVLVARAVRGAGARWLG